MRSAPVSGGQVARVVGRCHAHTVGGGADERGDQEPRGGVGMRTGV
ncbi:hypothetical protein FM110_00710 [Brachybacterium nesterenkovii]|uniref:Uncharacterized protein n=1 Tax=Brachybacterium nesterenkovii TaxID=47847 RepID=A0A1X6WSY8_9MICO|nr:hypothetical protein FM110_00710 [Brachybacterium nesterenkovii]